MWEQILCAVILLYKSSKVDSAVSIFVHLVHLRLSVQVQVTPPTEIL